MREFSTADAVTLGREIAAHLDAGEPAAAMAVTAPLLKRRVPFALLDRLAREFGRGQMDKSDPFLVMLAKHGAIGSWPIIGTALGEQLEYDLPGALERERTLVQIGDVWYAADTVGERTAGRALVEYLYPAIEQLERWRGDQNRWVRRSIGVAVHVWAKRNRGAERDKARRLLNLLEPLWGEEDIDAVKGIGWGLKTLGRYYPDLMIGWLLVQEKQPHRALMRRKARTYL
jgi:hypothetical protein